MPSARALACPSSLKGVLSAPEAAAFLRLGLEAGGIDAEELPVADGGEGTGEVLQRRLGGEWREARVADPLGRPVLARWLALPDGTAVVESAEVIGLGRLATGDLDPLHATSRGLGELLLAALRGGPRALLVCLGGTATVDGGAGLREVVDRLPVPTRVACDVRNPLLGPRGAARVYGPQKGASPEIVDELELRLARMVELRPHADTPGAGAGGGLGAALAALGGELVPGAQLVLEAIAFERRVDGAALAVTGEGTVDATTLEGKAPGAVLEASRRAGVRCAVFGGRLAERLPGVELHELSGDPRRAREDLRELGERLARTLAR